MQILTVSSGICGVIFVWLSIILACNHVCHGLTQQHKAGTDIRVQVCQNKDCCKRFHGKAQNLVQTIQHLCPGVEVESSACLSQCGKGPNICIVSPNGDEKFYGDIVDAASAAAVLEMSMDTIIPPTLIAAVNVMERSCQGEMIIE